MNVHTPHGEYFLTFGRRPGQTEPPTGNVHLITGGIIHGYHWDVRIKEIDLRYEARPWLTKGPERIACPQEAAPMFVSAERPKAGIIDAGRLLPAGLPWRPKPRARRAEMCWDWIDELTAHRQEQQQ